MTFVCFLLQAEFVGLLVLNTSQWEYDYQPPLLHIAQCRVVLSQLREQVLPGLKGQNQIHFLKDAEELCKLGDLGKMFLSLQHRPEFSA